MTDKLVTDTTTVQAPPAVVFAILADPRQHSRIDGSGSVGSVIDGPDRLSGKGDRFAVHMKMFGLPYRIENRVVEYEPDRLIAWRHFGGHRWRYALEASGEGTRVTETFDYSRYNVLWSTLIRLLGFPERNRAGIQATLERLKAAAESDLAAQTH